MGHIGILVVVRRLSRRWKVKTLQPYEGGDYHIPYFQQSGTAGSPGQS